MSAYYTDDLVTIFNADCRDVLPSIDPATVDLLLTDPPYGINLRTDNSSRGNRPYDKKAKALSHPPVYGDDEPFDPAPLLAFGRAILWGANNYAQHLPPSQSWLVWDRVDRGSNNADAELAWTNLGGTVRAYTHLWDGFKRASEIGRHLHPTQKPVSLMMWCLERAKVQRGDLVLDPYMGSGPLAQACHELGIRYIGIELVEDYCEVAVSRLRQQTLDLEGGAA